MYVWEPKWVKLLPFDYNFLGAFYYGLIWLDRKAWHKDVQVYPKRFITRTATKQQGRDQLLLMTPAEVATNILHQYVYSYDKSGNRGAL